MKYTYVQRFVTLSLQCNKATVTTREGAKEAPLLLLRAQARTLYVRSCARRRSRARAGEGALPLGPPSNFLFPPTRFPEAVALG